MKTVLLSGYRNSDFSETCLGVERDPTGQRLLDRQIHQLSQLGFEIVTVVAGDQADEQLRLCPRIANTELVFDTSDSVSLASNLKAGLNATDGEACFAIPVEVTPPPADLWRFLNQELRRIGFHNVGPVLQAVDAQGAPWHFGFPLLITRKGNQLIRELTNFRSLTDPRLPFDQAVYTGHGTLAPHLKDA